MRKQNGPHQMVLTGVLHDHFKLKCVYLNEWGKVREC